MASLTNGVQFLDENGNPITGLTSSSGVPVKASGSFNNASVGTIGATAPTSATLVGGSDGTNLQAYGIDNVASGVGEIRASLYGKNVANGDQPVGVTAGAAVKVQVNAVLAGLTGVNAVPTNSGSPAGTAGDISASGTNATVTATLAAVAAKSWYITGFTITALQSTGAGAADVTISGLQNTLTMEYVTDTLTVGFYTTIIVSFPIPRPASANNTAVSVSVAALGANTGKCSVTLHGQNF